MADTTKISWCAAGAIGRAIGMPPRRATGLTRCLERRGLITVTPSGNRAMHYAPTDHGRRELARLTAVAEAA